MAFPGESGGAARDANAALETAMHGRELEARLRLRERWFETTLRSIGDAVISTDAKGFITFMNPVAERLTGCAAADTVGQPIDKVFRLVDPSGNPVESPVWSVLASNSAADLPPDTSLVVGGGRRIVIDDRVTSIADDEGNVVGSVIIFRDVTFRRGLEQRLAQAERLASVGTMAAGVGHEINNPLCYAITNIAFSREKLCDAGERLRLMKVDPADRPSLDWCIERFEDIGHALRDASDGTERVRVIVRELRKFARVDAGPRETIDVRQAVEAAIQLTSSTIRHHARLRQEFGATPLVESDPGQLTQVLTNLIVNAAQAIGEGRADDHEIAIRTTTDAGGRAVVEVFDTGPGIPAHVLPHIFDPFFTTKPVGAGMGLGLAICHEIVVASGGEITVDTRPGGGTTFRVALPPARSKSVRPTDPVRASWLPTRPGRVLVIDDEKAVAEAVARLLRTRHDVVVETDARAALARIAGRESFDVIFCDLMMPNFSGIDFYKAVASSSPDVAKRIVFMTGGAFTPRSRAFLESVANVLLDKPFTKEAIRTVVHDYMK
jgi:PAS domain S-box-containing protein